MGYGLIVHGGARLSISDGHNRLLGEILRAGRSALARGASSLDAVEIAVRMAEDSGMFNAGSGSHLNLVGDVEMDACIMEGTTLKSGAVGAVPKVKNPISVARKVMEETDHILMVGDGATRFARAFGFEEYTYRNPQCVDHWRHLRQELETTGILSGVNLPDPDKLKKWLEVDKEGCTFGAVARDQAGTMAAGISSGGTPMKLPGRVGDVAIVGSGIFVNNEIGGVSLTGTGEVMIRFSSAKMVLQQMADGFSPQAAAERTIQTISKAAGRKFVLGIVAMDKGGNFGAARNLDGMPHGCLGWDSNQATLNFGEIITP